MNSQEFPGSTSQGRKLVAGGRRAGTEARRRRAEAEARRRWPALVGSEQGMRRRRMGMRREAQHAGVRDSASSRLGRRRQAYVPCVFGLGRIHKADTYQPTYPIFVKIIKKSDTSRIRIHGVSDTYPYPIRIGYAIRGFLQVSV